MKKVNSLMAAIVLAAFTIVIIATANDSVGPRRALDAGQKSVSTGVKDTNNVQDQTAPGDAAKSKAMKNCHPSAKLKGDAAPRKSCCAPR